jgi:D-sedoheptulose 7-phosphate isomerase
VLWAGNGGSAADAQHLAAELSGRFYYDRPPLFSEALHVNTSYTTAVANDYSYDEIYARLTRAMGRKGDVLIGMSTSGNSGNVVKALEVANQLGLITVGFTGETGGKMAGLCKHLVNIPSKDTPRIQECHMVIGHTICELVEINLFPKK